MDETPDDDNADTPDSQRLAVKSRGLDTAKQLAAVTLREAGNSLQAIADALGVDRGTVSRFLANVLSSEDARKLLELKRGRAIEAWGTAMEIAATKGIHAPARDLLIATDVVDEKVSRSTGVIINVGNGQQPVHDVSGIPTITVIETTALSSDRDPPERS